MLFSTVCILRLLIVLVIVLAVYPCAAGADKNEELIEAARLGRLTEVTNLLNCGADINAKDREGWTALMKAAQQRRVDVVRLLLGRRDIDLNVRNDEGWTALDYVKGRGLEDTEALLRTRGAQTEEELETAKLGDIVLRRGDELFLRLKDGETVSRKNRSKDQEGPSDASGDTNVTYKFHELIEPWFVLKEGYYESSGTQFINRDTGAIKKVYGNSKFSPGNTHFLALDSVCECPCDMEIWKLSRSKITREYILEDSCHDSSRWLDRSTVDVAISRDSEEFGAEAHIKLEGAAWKCSGSPQLCKKEKTKGGLGKTINMTRGSSEDSDELLRKALELGALDAVKILLDQGTDINAENHHDQTPLQMAAQSGHVEMVKLLLDRGADINAEGRYGDSALKSAALEGNLQMVKLLKDRGAKPTLIVAAILGDVEEVRGLIEKGADPEEVQGWPPILWASSKHRWDVVKVLLEYGPDISKEPDFARVALMKAAGDGHMEFVRLLLDRNKDLAAQHGSAALERASPEGHLGIVNLLLDEGADINGKDQYGRTALMSAAIRGKLEVVQPLLDRGADIAAKDNDGVTVLMDATWGGNPKVVKLLLDKGADVNARAKSGETALKTAQKASNKEIEEFLRARGAKE